MPEHHESPHTTPRQTRRPGSVAVRAALIGAVATLSVAFAAAVLWSWLTPEILARVGAAPLVALLAMFVLPAVVMWLARIDRRFAAGAVAQTGDRTVRMALGAGRDHRVSSARPLQLAQAPARSGPEPSPAAPRSQPVGATSEGRIRRLSA